jgi:hypothetical protein
MLRRLFWLLLFILVLGCSPKDKRYKDIDFIAYSWRIPNKGKEWRFYYSTYALIENTGHCKFVIQRYYPKSEIKYCEIYVDKEVITNIINSSKSNQKEIDLRPKVGTSMYDGPNMKIRINTNEKNVIIHFFDDDSEQVKDFVKLYRLISSIYNSNKYSETKDTNFLLKRKREFIMYSMKSDSVLRPPPPPPSESVFRQ